MNSFFNKNQAQATQSNSQEIVKEIAIEGMIVIIVLILIFGTLNYFNILDISGLYPKQLGWLPQKHTNISVVQTNQTGIQPTQTPPTINLPIASNDPLVISASINYVLAGKVENITSINNVPQVIFKTLQNKLISLPITSETRIQKGSRTKQVTITLKDIKSGTPISSSVVYNPKTNSWKTWSIFVSDPTIK